MQLLIHIKEDPWCNGIVTPFFEICFMCQNFNKKLAEVLIFYQNYFLKFIAVRENFMSPFHKWGSTASRLQIHYEETVCFLPISLQVFFVLIR